MKILKKLGVAGFLFFLLKGLLWLAILLGAGTRFTSCYSTQTDAMKIAVYDTYVTRKDGQLMHFDILVSTEERDLEKIYGYGQAYLSTKGQEKQPLTAQECRFCHIGQASAEIQESIGLKGYFIIEMEGCN